MQKITLFFWFDDQAKMGGGSRGLIRINGLYLELTTFARAGFVV